MSAQTDRAEVIGRLLREHRSALAAVEQAERTYAAVVAGYREKFGDTVTADFKAKDDVRLQQALADAAWKDRQALRYGIAVLVELKLLEMGGPR